MILYIRDTDNNNIADVEIWVERKNVSLISRVFVERYSKVLISLFGQEQMSFIDEMTSVQDLSSWFWDQQEQGKLRAIGDTEEQYKEVLRYTRRKLKRLTEKYNLKIQKDKN